MRRSRADAPTPAGRAVTGSRNAGRRLRRPGHTAPHRRPAAWMSGIPTAVTYDGRRARPRPTSTAWAGRMEGGLRHADHRRAEPGVDAGAQPGPAVPAEADPA